MYSASAQFHNAVFGNSPVERVLFKFADGTIFTNEDIHIGNGLKVIEAVNLEEELTIGACPASSMDVTVMNYHGLLSGFAFGEAEVSLGVRTEIVAGNPVSANAVTYVGGRQFCGYSTEPYLKLDGETTVAQPGFPVHAIVAVGLDVYCIGLEGQIWKATLTGGTTWNDLEPEIWDDLAETTWESLQGTLTEVGAISLNAFMTAKAARWATQGKGLWSNSNVVYEYFTDGTADKYEYVKLGTFLLNTPAKRKINMIAVSSLDRMSLFDKEADDFWNGLTYPITIGEIFTQLCAFVGVPKATVTFINSTRSFTEAPMVAEGITAREILGWIAGAAGCFARMTRDGEVELAWFGEKAVSIPMTQYFSISPAEYEVAPIDKLQILGSETDIGVIIGEGTNGYQIMDNPLLYGETDEEIRALGVPIYNRLAAFEAFSPIVATAVCDWSIQAGDIIEIVLNGTAYALPIYLQTITWNGSARVSYESTGTERRPVMDKMNRRIYSQNRVIHEVRESVDEWASEFVTKDGVVSSINQTTEEIKIAAGKISLEGVITANNYFKINENGSMETIAGKIGAFTLTSTQLSSAALTINISTGLISFGSYGGIYGDSEYNGLVLASDDDISIDAEDVQIGETPTTYLNPYFSLNIFRSDPSGGPFVPNTRIDIDTGEIYRTTHSNSSILAKKNVEPILPDMTDKLYSLTPVIYQRKSTGQMEYGLIAEDVEQVFPELVYRDSYEIGISYDRLSVLLLAELKKIHSLLEGKHGLI